MKKGRDTTQEERILIAKDCIASDKNSGESALKYNVKNQQAPVWTLGIKALDQANLKDSQDQLEKTPHTEMEKNTN